MYFHYADWFLATVTDSLAAVTCVCEGASLPFESSSVLHLEEKPPSFLWVAQLCPIYLAGSPVAFIYLWVYEERAQGSGLTGVRLNVRE